MRNGFCFVALSAAAIGLAACGALGGPSAADIEKIARQQMETSLGGEGMPAEQKQALRAAVEKAEISKKGICNTAKKDLYACMVDVTITMPGTDKPTEQTFVVEIVPDGQGWKGAE